VHKGRLLKTFGLFLLSALCAFAETTVPLGSAASFGVLAYSTVTNGGATVIAGNVGTSPGTSITGFPPGKVTAPSMLHRGDGVAAAAEVDLATAYANAAAQPSTANLTGQDLGGLTLIPGVYTFDSSATLTGTLILNGAGLYIFQIGSTLLTASGSAVVAENGALASNIFWQVGSSATLGSSTSFIGNILANASITNNSSGTVDGRLLALNGAVTLADEAVTYPPAIPPGGPGGAPLPATPVPSSWMLVLIGLACVMLYQTRERWLRRLKNG
jgi:type VI secretion system secreted protein VgrG